MNDEPLIISDLHLGGGWFNTAAFDACLRYHAIRATHLIVNGDAFEFAHNPDDPITVLQRVRELFPRVFTALSWWLDAPRRRLTFIWGNHDTPLGRPEVQAALRKMLGRPDRLSFASHLFIQNSFIEHGHQYEPMNRHSGHLAAAGFITTPDNTLPADLIAKIHATGQRYAAPLQFARHLLAALRARYDYLTPVAFQIAEEIANHTRPRAIIFGHTHLPHHIITADGLHVFNSGSWIARPPGGKTCTFIRLSAQTPALYHWTLDGPREIKPRRSVSCVSSSLEKRAPASLLQSTGS